MSKPLQPITPVDSHTYFIPELNRFFGSFSKNEKVVGWLHKLWIEHVKTVTGATKHEGISVWTRGTETTIVLCVELPTTNHGEKPKYQVTELHHPELEACVQRCVQVAWWLKTWEGASKYIQIAHRPQHSVEEFKFSYAVTKKEGE